MAVSGQRNLFFSVNFLHFLVFYNDVCCSENDRNIFSFLSVSVVGDEHDHLQVTKIRIAGTRQ